MPIGLYGLQCPPGTLLVEQSPKEWQRNIENHDAENILCVPNHFALESKARSSESGIYQTKGCIPIGEIL